MVRVVRAVSSNSGKSGKSGKSSKSVPSTGYQHLVCMCSVILPFYMTAGSIQEAVELVNDVDPEILDTNPTLFFHLQQQQLLELIKEVWSNEFRFA